MSSIRKKTKQNPAITFLLIMSQIYPLISMSFTSSKPTSSLLSYLGFTPWLLPSRFHSLSTIYIDFYKKHMIMPLGSPMVFYPSWHKSPEPLSWPPKFLPVYHLPIYSGTFATIFSLLPRCQAHRHPFRFPHNFQASLLPVLFTVLGALLSAFFPGQIEFILLFSVQLSLLLRHL